MKDKINFGEVRGIRSILLGLLLTFLATLLVVTLINVFSNNEESKIGSSVNYIAGEDPLDYQYSGSNGYIERDDSYILEEQEIEDLIFMHEEEKLARDVYNYLYELWGERIFQNIAKSEQKHFDSLAVLMVNYQIEDKTYDEPGLFSNENLQILYDDLIAKGSVSLEEALRVGALIEDVDIFDLENGIKNTDEKDIIQVYENLQRGSRNHMRAFTSSLERLGISYSPQYISNNEYLEIINSEKERGGGNSNGRGRH